MRNKIFGLFAFSIFALVFLMSAVSAAVDFVNVTGATQIVSQGSIATISFALQESGYGNLTNMSFNVPLTLASGTNTLVSASSVTGMVTILNQSTTSGIMSLTFAVPSTKAIGDYTGDLVLTGTYTSVMPYSLPLSITVTSEDPQEVLDCSTITNSGKLKVKDIDFTNRGMSQNQGLSHTKFGDDNEWFPLDEIEVDIEIENKGDDDVDDIEVEWGIYDTQENRWIIELEDEKDFNLKDDDEETLTISFQLENDLDVDLEDLDDGEHYRFYVIATGTVDDTGSPQTCVSDYELAEIIIESDFVVLYNIEYPETVMCGETVQITADVWNIGDEDQDEVSVDLVAKGLGLDKTTLIGDIDAFDNDKFSFTFTVPNDAEEKTHTLKFQVWDDDNHVYENDFDEDESEFFLPLKVEGGCGVGAAEVSIFATLESEAKAGKEMVIKSTITNQGDELRIFTVNAAGFAQWASSYTADRTSLILGAGESADVLFTFDVNKDASGSYSFTIELMSEGNLVTTQPVLVNIESTRPFLGITGLVTGSNAYLWGIGLLNIILIVIIILIAVRIARRK